MSVCVLKLKKKPSYYYYYYYYIKERVRSQEGVKSDVKQATTLYLHQQ